MASTASATRAQSAARTRILDDLKDDHKRVKKAYKGFQKLDIEDDAEECEAIVQEVLEELTLHAAIEEELLYPAAKDALEDRDLIEEAEVEHESMHTAIDQLRDMGPGDEKYAARFTVLCEYVLHHVKEEEGEMFPQLEKVRLDWESMAAEIDTRREQAAGEEEGDEDDDEAAVGSDDSTATPPKPAQAAPRRASGTAR